MRRRGRAVRSLDVDDPVLVTGGLVVGSAALLQRSAFYDDGRAVRRQRSNDSGGRDDAPRRAPGHAADVPCRARLIDAGIPDASSGRPDAGSSAPYAGLVDAWVARMQRPRQGGKRRANDQDVPHLVSSLAHRPTSINGLVQSRPTAAEPRTQGCCLETPRSNRRRHIAF